MNDRYDWDMNIFEYILGFSSVEWAELNRFIKEEGE